MVRHGLHQARHFFGICANTALEGFNSRRFDRRAVMICEKAATGEGGKL
jgi:hypothetical protein